jgi:hypothetical protein
MLILRAVSTAVATALLLLVGVVIGAGGYYVASNLTAAPAQTSNVHMTTHSYTLIKSGDSDLLF